MERLREELGRFSPQKAVIKPNKIVKKKQTKKPIYGLWILTKGHKLRGIYSNKASEFQ